MSFSQELLVRRNVCRICADPLGDELISFADLPVAGAYVSPNSPPPDPVFPLALLRCSSCGLVQLRESLSPSFYSHYSFMSGVATGYKEYLSLFAEHLAESLESGSSVLEIGCSDGTLLQSLREAGFSVAGFEPATGPARAAQGKGLRVVNEFFHVDSAAQSGFEPADLVVIRHVLEHIDDFPAIFAGLDQLTAPGATLLIEVPDLTSTVEKSIHSNIYHIHPCYFDVNTMSNLLERHGWTTEGSTVVDIFGGSLLLWARRKDAPPRQNNERSPLSFDKISRHAAHGVTRAKLHDFILDWKGTAQATRQFFDEFRDQGKRVAGYGAAERTTSLMGVAGLDNSHVSAIFDRNPNLIGKALPSSRVPILDPDTISEYKPEYLVIFAQSFEDEIIRQQSAFREAGGRFISLRMRCPTVLP
jgi:SAM-dependent methyltransferase